MNEEEYANCKIIFTLRYFPTNNNWQPFTNFIHDAHKYITIEYGIYTNSKKTCPKWLYPTSTSSFLTEQVKQDILNYTCNSACGEDNNICRNVKSWNIGHNQGMKSSNVKWLHPSLAVNYLKTPDSCWFETYFEYSPKFCEESWGGVQPVMVPDEIKEVYPQFITVPSITTWSDERPILKNSCSKLWQSGEHLELY